MQKLDDIKSDRDLVQFVQFNKYKGNIDNLSKEVLMEIPGQIEKYYKMRDIS